MAVLALAVTSFLLLLLVFWLWRRTRRLGRRIDALTRGEEGKDLGAILDAHLDKVFAVSAEVDELTVRTAVAEANLRRSFQRIGLVRFNPFEDTGGNQSFALALLDANGDGDRVQQPPLTHRDPGLCQGRQRWPVRDRPLRGGDAGGARRDGRRVWANVGRGLTG